MFVWILVIYNLFLFKFVLFFCIIMNRSQLDGVQGLQTPYIVGRGRGLIGSPIPFPDIGSGIGRGLGRAAPNGLANSTHMPQTQFGSPPVLQAPCSSTPNATHDILSQMGDIVHQIGQQLADSLLTHLRTSPAAVTTSGVDHDSRASSQNPVSNASQLHVVSQRKVKDPPAFRGDSSDTVTLEEWIELMRTFIRKGGLPIEEQGEEILIHLRGKAKDVVRVAIKSSGVDISRSPDSIYSLLRKHFTCKQFSHLPLQDFYTTLPEPQEGPYDYWLRLNHAADVTTECLKEQGKPHDSMSVEVTRMFIRNCPSSDLAVTFRSKTIDKWSAAEVQEVLSEYHSEGVIKAAGKRNDKRGEVAINRVEVNAISTPLRQAENPSQPVCGLQSAPHTLSSQPSSADHSTLERLISMMERVLMNDTQSRSVSRRASGLPRLQGLNDTPCLVCKDVSHSALSHCKENRLCFQCFSPDHARNRCPHRGKSTVPGSQPSN